MAELRASPVVNPSYKRIADVLANLQGPMGEIIPFTDANPFKFLMPAASTFENLAYGNAPFSEYAGVTNRRLPIVKTGRENELTDIADVALMASGLPMASRGVARGANYLGDVLTQATRAAPPAAPMRTLNEVAATAPAPPQGMVSQLSPSAPTDVSYRGSHLAPNAERYGATLDDLGKIMPKDVYSSKGIRLYGSGDDQVDSEWFAAAYKAKGNPDKMIEIYRAVPKGVKDINEGDFVTTSKTYAKNHGESALGGDYDIVSMKVKANTLSSEGYPYEFGYNTGQSAMSGTGNVVKPGDEVSGLIVREHIPNKSSIAASFDDYEILSGIREVPRNAFDPEYLGSLSYDKLDQRTKDLAEQIRQSKEINPLIVGVDSKGAYIVEGGHRFDALMSQDFKSIPALVVIDKSDPPFDLDNLFTK
jgi:hypothetical protein